MNFGVMPILSRYHIAINFHRNQLLPMKKTQIRLKGEKDGGNALPRTGQPLKESWRDYRMPKKTTDPNTVQNTARFKNCEAGDL